jgi:glucuronoarabinoxylan endo-1,4-beta-xylanase
MMGDGQRGAGSSGTITKRGYIMAHFAKFITGMTRIDATFGGGLEGSAYLSPSGDTLVAVLSNSSDNTIDLTFDLPFYTLQGELYLTGKSQNFKKTDLTSESATCRPVATIGAKSVATALFVKSGERQPSNMTGSVSYFDYKRIDDLTTTKSTFGTAYKLSGKSKTFNHSNPLISSRTDANYGYVKIDEGMKKLVFEVKTLTSNMNYSSALTTLTYVNSQGQVTTHNYGDLEFPVHENFQWVFDLSTATLPDGCIGLISMTNNNWSSNLQFTFGNVYLTGGSSLYAGKLSGDYVADDSYVLDFSTDPNCTSIDMTAVTALPATLPWLEGSNRVVYVSGNSNLSGTNVVKDGVCASLVIDERVGPFHPAQTFTATQASYTCEVNCQHIVQLPFRAIVPEGVNAYLLTDNLTPVAVTEVAANQPLLVEGHGVVTFFGTGEVSYISNPLSDDVLPIETPTAIRTVRHISSDPFYYDLHGKRIDTPHKGVVIRNGKKYINKR